MHCQMGRAAPLFVLIETTRAGLGFAVGGGTAGSGDRTRIEEEKEAQCWIIR